MCRSSETLPCGPHVNEQKKNDSNKERKFEKQQSKFSFKGTIRYNLCKNSLVKQ